MSTCSRKSPPLTVQVASPCTMNDAGIIWQSSASTQNCIDRARPILPLFQTKLLADPMRATRQATPLETSPRNPTHWKRRVRASRGNSAIHPNQSIRATIGLGRNNRKKGRTKARDKPTRRANKTTHRVCSHKRRLEERETTAMNEPSRTRAPRAIQYPSRKAKFTW